jgi:large subunit ribosomal protein L4
MQVTVKDSSGREVDTVEVSDELLSVPFKRSLVHQALVAQRANARQGTAASKTRGQVSGGGRKPRPQKHTGRSRQGSIRSPQWRGGGVVFGPQPRSYRQRLPKKMRRLAIRSLLSEKVRTEHLIVLDKLNISRPQTQAMTKVLTDLGISQSALVITGVTNSGGDTESLGQERAVALSVRNIKKTKWISARFLNVGDLARYQFAVITVDGLRQAEGIWVKNETANVSTDPVTGGSEN